MRPRDVRPSASSKIPRLQLDRVDVQVGHVHVARLGNWSRITTIGPMATMLGLVAAAGDEREVIHRRGPWRSFETVEFATLIWVDWFNNRRLLQPIGNIPPAEAEARYYAMINEQKLAA
jgi:transposase InsO family protein